MSVTLCKGQISAIQSAFRLKIYFGPCEKRSFYASVLVNVPSDFG